jgi:hypothetical protein
LASIQRPTLSAIGKSRLQKSARFSLKIRGREPLDVFTLLCLNPGLVYGNHILFCNKNKPENNMMSYDYYFWDH